MPTPSGLISGAASKIRQGMPAWCSRRPSVSPPMPAPTMMTSLGPCVIRRLYWRTRGHEPDFIAKLSRSPAPPRVPADLGVRHGVGRGEVGLEVDEGCIVEAVEPDHRESRALDS